MITSTIIVQTAQPYPVYIGTGLGDQVPVLVRENVPGARMIAIIYQPSLTATAVRLIGALEEAGFVAHRIEVPDSEAGKDVQVLEYCWNVFGQIGLTRTDAVISLGGGAVSDLAGFVAATWMRGVRVVHIPTTILGMVDAGVGGKTGINTNAGKNLVGSFHEPSAVIVDVAAAQTLPHNDVVAGFAEIVKAGLIRDVSILDDVQDHADAVLDPGSPEQIAVVTKAIAVKAEVVARDLRESGEREILNYGHTLGHAIEAREKYNFRHGAAVAIGMIFVAELSRLAGKLSDADVDRHYAILHRLGLPTKYDPEAFADLLRFMGLDKKATGGIATFVVLDALGSPSRLRAPDPSLLLGAYEAMHAV